MPRKSTARIGSVRIKKGPRKGQTVTAYIYPNGKWKEIKRGRGATAERRAAGRAAGLKDRFGRTAEQRGAIRRARAAKPLRSSGKAMKTPSVKGKVTKGAPMKKRKVRRKGRRK